MTSRRYPSTQFAHENWEPPDRELRKIRGDFYGPLTAKLLAEAQAGDKLEEEATRARQAALRRQAKARWGLAGRKVAKAGDAIHRMHDMAQDKWFSHWQEKKVVKIDPPPPPRISGDESVGSRSTMGGASSATSVTAATARGGSEEAASTPSTAAAIRSDHEEMAALKGMDDMDRPNGPVGMRLFCFPWEGGSAMIFERLSWKVPNVQLIAINYPGRAHRCREPMEDDLKKVCEFPFRRQSLQPTLAVSLNSAPHALLRSLHSALTQWWHRYPPSLDTPWYAKVIHSVQTLICIAPLVLGARGRDSRRCAVCPLRPRHGRPRCL